MKGERNIRFVHRLRNIVPSLTNCLGISVSCWMDSDIFLFFFFCFVYRFLWVGGADVSCSKSLELRVESSCVAKRCSEQGLGRSNYKGTQVHNT